MKSNEIKDLLDKVARGDASVDEALKTLETLPFSDLGYAVIDHHRAHRTGHPEVIYCEGKTTDHILGIINHMSEKKSNILATRVSPDVYEEVQKHHPELHYNPLGRTMTLIHQPHEKHKDYVAIVAAGTSDLPVVEEAYETLSALGFEAMKIVDVGVAGIHRLFNRLDDIRGAKVVIVVAGMEGALASVVGGLVDKPVIAVPTSVGYGASFGGISALLTMLNSCSSGVTVVNIDNGFGAAFAASQMMRL